MNAGKARTKMDNKDLVKELRNIAKAEMMEYGYDNYKTGEAADAIERLEAENEQKQNVIDAYAEAARVITFYLDTFCDRSLD